MKLEPATYPFILRTRLLHRELHRPAAVDDASRRVDMQNALRGDGGDGEGLEVFIGLEEGEVGHGVTSQISQVHDFNRNFVITTSAKIRDHIPSYSVQTIQ